MRSVRFISVLFVAILGMLAMAIPLSGCVSQPAAYTEAATPLSDNLLNDFDAYTLIETDAGMQSENAALGASFRAAVKAGNAKVASSKWFGSGNIRSRLFDYWNTDPKFTTPGGFELLQIKIHNAEALDYILSVGQPQ